MEPVNTAELVAAGSTVPRDRRGLGGLAVLLLIAAYIGTLAFEYYFRVGGVRRHHLESAWMWMVAACVLFTLTSRRSVEARERPIERWRPPASTTLVVAVVLALAGYYPALGLGFLSDDFTLADLAARNQFFGQSWTFLRPLPLLGYKAAGAHPAALHLFNVVLHGVNAALVSRLAMVFGLAPVQASAAGLLFLLFPAHLEAVAWCAGIQDVLMTTGVLGSILAATVSGAALSMAALIASLFSKETAVAAPILMVLSNRQRWRGALGALAVDGQRPRTVGVRRRRARLLDVRCERHAGGLEVRLPSGGRVVDAHRGAADAGALAARARARRGGLRHRPRGRPDELCPVDKRRQDARRSALRSGASEGGGMHRYLDS
jgi:hypothetical protein